MHESERQSSSREHDSPAAFLGLLPHEPFKHTIPVPHPVPSFLFWQFQPVPDVHSLHEPAHGPEQHLPPTHAPDAQASSCPQLPPLLALHAPLTHSKPVPHPVPAALSMHDHPVPDVHSRQAPLHAPAQHLPLTQAFDVHSLSPPQFSPLSFFGGGPQLPSVQTRLLPQDVLLVLLPHIQLLLDVHCLHAPAQVSAQHLPARHEPDLHSMPSLQS
jgi:hypothetical protein